MPLRAGGSGEKKATRIYRTSSAEIVPTASGTRIASGVRAKEMGSMTADAIDKQRLTYLRLVDRRLGDFLAFLASWREEISSLCTHNLIDA